MKRLGVPDNAAGRQMLIEHLTLSAKTEGNIMNTFSNQYGKLKSESRCLWAHRVKLLIFTAHSRFLMTEPVSSAQSYRFTEDAAMMFLSTIDFMEEFGIEPVEVDPSLALCRYIKKSESSELEVDLSFSAVMKSFQVVLRLSMQELAVVSSENVRSIELVRDSSGAGVHVVFEFCNLLSEARVIFVPEVSFRWWILRKV
jgi:hypothetical protein